MSSTKSTHIRPSLVAVLPPVVVGASVAVEPGIFALLQLRGCGRGWVGRGRGNGRGLEVGFVDLFGDALGVHVGAEVVEVPGIVVGVELDDLLVDGLDCAEKAVVLGSSGVE